MKRTIFVALVMIFSLGATTASSMDFDPKIGSGMSEITQMPTIADGTVATESKTLAQPETSVADEVDSEVLLARIEEIRDMDKSELSKEEKQELRNELRDTKEILQSRGIYIGAGTLILVIILIILLTR